MHTCIITHVYCQLPPLFRKYIYIFIYVCSQEYISEKRGGGQ